MKVAHIQNTVLLRELAVIAAGALGYFADIYDLSVFSISRQQSLLDLGVSRDLSAAVGISLYYWQLIGLAAGGLLWGIIGDKKGRIRILYFSIIVYSIATWLNAYVHSIMEYSLLRLVAGLGLAGELGAGVTLVCEVMRKYKRGYGTMVMASLGCLGVICAVLINQHLGWRLCYQIGGYMGIFILLLRTLTAESEIYTQISTTPSGQRGNFSYLFKSKGLFLKYLRCILAGTPIYFVLGVLVLLTPEYGKVYQLNVTVGTATLFFYISNTISDLLCPILSQWLASRKKAILTFLGLALLSFVVFFFSPAATNFAFYLKYAALGIGIGYWATLLSYISEQFGTNFRATATTSIPNFIRALAIPLLLLNEYLTPEFTILKAGFILGVVSVAIAAIAILLSKETFSNDLNFQEVIH
jgi:MFS transporter, putative metabolite:H+ symporter